MLFFVISFKGIVANYDNKHFSEGGLGTALVHHFYIDSWEHRNVKIDDVLDALGCMESIPRLEVFVDEIPYSSQIQHRLAPLKLDALSDLKDCYIAMGYEEEEVRKVYQIMSKLAPLDFKLFVSWAEFELDRGDKGEAFDAIERALEIYPYYDEAIDLKNKILDKK
jgi:hypothetical protein